MYKFGIIRSTVVVLLSCLLVSCGKQAANPVSQLVQQITDLSVGDPAVSLFDGEQMGLWEQTEFEQEGKSYVEDGMIVMSKGMDMSGITWTGPVVRMNYEITLEAMRVDGFDFFCGLTFPVKDDPCTLVLGGWGGTTVGLSNIDYYDAMNNETMTMVEFENNKWYQVRLRVTEKKIQGWVDDEMIVDFAWPGHKLDIRMEVDMSAPLGIATWQTGGAVRNIQIRRETEAAESPEDPYML